MCCESIEMKLSAIVIPLLWVSIVHGANIFAIMPTFSHSHYVLAVPLLRELSEDGHNLTVVTLKAAGIKTNTYHEVVPKLPAQYKIFFDDFRKSSFEQTDKNPFMQMFNFSTLARDMSIDTFKSSQFQDLLRNKDVKYDLLITEVFGAEAFLGIASNFSIPVVGISTLRSNPWVQGITGTPIPSSFVPLVVSSLPREMNFFQRCQNTLMNFFMEVVVYFLFDPAYEYAYKEMWPNAKLSYKQQKKEAFSLMLMNSHISIDGPQPLMTNIIEVGGMQVNTKTKDLPADMQKFMDSATNGVILFSLGSNLDASYVDAEKRQAIVDILAAQDKKVILKWDHPDSVAEHVSSGKFFTARWFPQSDLLAHNSTDLFVAHGGLGGITESIYHGVPLVVIPIFGDQKQNARAVREFGIGVQLDYTNLTRDSFDWAVHEVLYTQSYKNTVTKLSTRYRDRPQESLDVAKFWVEYVIRHKGARFLRSPALKLNFFQYHSLDVYLFLFLSILVVFYGIVKILKFATRKIIKVSNKTKKKKE